MIRKFVAIALCLCMLCALPAMAESAEILGTWYLNNIEMGGIALSPASLEMEMTMTLNEDGSALLIATGEETIVGSWKMEDGVVLVNDGASDMLLTLSEGNLVAAQEGITMVFGREPAAAEAAQAAPAVAAADIKEFDGTWNATTVIFMDAALPAESIGISMQLAIADGALIIIEDSESSQEAVQGALTDGSLVITEGEGEDAVTLTLTLCEDGTLTIEEEGAVIIFTKIPEAE